MYFNGNHEGTISTKIRGRDTDKNGLIYGIFFSYGHEKTLAQMTDEERNNRVRCPQNTSAVDEFADSYQMTKKLVK